MAPLLTFLVAIEAKPGSNLVFDPPREVGGYCQTLGVTASNEDEMLQLVRDFIYNDLQSTLVEIYEVWVPDFEERDKDIAEVCGDTLRPGIWYSSGHAWFPPEKT